MAFVHLHNHTVFSMLDGATRIQDMVNRAVELGMPAVALPTTATCMACPTWR